MNNAGLVWRERTSDSNLIASVWSCMTTSETTRPVIADPCSSIALITENGSTKVVIRGPETRPRKEQLAAGYKCTVIRLRPGVVLKGFAVRKFVNRSLSIWSSAQSQFWFHGTYWQFPDYDSAEMLVEQLHHAGYLQSSTLSTVNLQLQSTLSPRAYSRFVKRTTGLSPYRLYQLGRTHQALRLFKQGNTATEVALELDFVDQAHLIHAVKRFLGYTPKQLLHLPQLP